MDGGWTAANTLDGRSVVWARLHLSEMCLSAANKHCDWMSFEAWFGKQKCEKSVEAKTLSTIKKTMDLQF